MKWRFILLFILFPCLGYSQVLDQLQGQVVDGLNQTVANATVYLLEADRQEKTDTQGRFSFDAVIKGNYTLLVEVSSPLQEAIVYLSKDSDWNNVLIKVKPKDRLLDNITIQAKSKIDRLQHAAIKSDIVQVQTSAIKSTSIQELINSTPGVKIRSIGGLGANSNIIVGGFTGNAVRFLVDDIPMDYLGSSYGINKVPTNMLERVEVYKGVLPSKIGIDALGSAINLVTLEKKETAATFSYETGSYNTHIGSVNASILLSPNWSLGTNSFYNYSDNNFRVNNLPYVEEKTGNTTYIKAKLFHNSFEQANMQFYVQGNDLCWADKISFSVHSYELSKDIQNDAYSRARAFGKAYRKEKGSFIPSLTYKKAFLDHRLQWTQFLVYSKIDYELFDKAKNVYYDWKGNAHQTVSSSEMGNLVIKDGYLKNTQSQFTTRGNLSYLLSDYVLIENNTVFSHYNTKSTLDDLNSSGTNYQKLVSSFAIDFTLFESRVFLNTQVKFLHGHLKAKYNASDNPHELSVKEKTVSKTGMSFSQAVKYQIDKQNYIRFSYENTYRLPDKEEFFGDNNFVISNYDLNPEKSYNLNLGYTFTDKKLAAQVNTYYRKTTDLIRLKDINQYQAVFLNLDKVKGFGVEVDVNYKPIKHLAFSANLTWNDFRLESSKDNLLNTQHYKKARIANMPFYYTNFSVSYNFKDVLSIDSDLSLYWNYSYVHQYYLDFIEKQFEPNGFLGLWGDSKINTSRIIPVQHLNNIGIVYQKYIGKHQVAVSTEVKNLFNHEIYNEFKMQNPGRNYRVKLTYSF